MKKLILLSSLFIFSTSLFSQNRRADMEKRIESHRIAFITEHLELTPDEAEKFWPIFNEFKSKEKAIRKSNRNRQSVEDMTEAEAEAYIESRLKNEEQDLANRKVYLQKFKTVLPIKKVAKLFEAEHAFKKEVLRHLKDKRKRDN